MRTRRCCIALMQRNYLTVLEMVIIPAIIMGAPMISHIRSNEVRKDKPTKSRVAPDAILVAVIHFRFLASASFKIIMIPAAIRELPNPPNDNARELNNTPIREQRTKEQMRKSEPMKNKVALNAILVVIIHFRFFSSTSFKTIMIPVANIEPPKSINKYDNP